MNPHVPTWEACLTSAMTYSKQHEKQSMRKKRKEEAMTTHKRRVRHSPGSVVEANQREIERAVSRVKGYRRGYWPAQLSRQRQGPGEPRRDGASLLKKRRPFGQRERSPGFDKWDRVNVVGKVPREFFRWLEEQTETDWVAREMLEQCLFEERWR